MIIDDPCATGLGSADCTSSTQQDLAHPSWSGSSLLQTAHPGHGPKRAKYPGGALLAAMTSPCTAFDNNPLTQEITWLGTKPRGGKVSSVHWIRPPKQSFVLSRREGQGTSQGNWSTAAGGQEECLLLSSNNLPHVQILYELFKY